MIEQGGSGGVKPGDFRGVEMEVQSSRTLLVLGKSWAAPRESRKHIADQLSIEARMTCIAAGYRLAIGEYEQVVIAGGMKKVDRQSGGGSV